MKLAILGGNGFIGKRLVSYFKNKHQVISITRDTLNLLNYTDVVDFLAQHKFDVIINCAACMTDDLTLFDARNNFGIFMNMYNCSNLYGKFINLASGAEFDLSTNIHLALEEDIFKCMPSNSYGWGHNMKARICANTDRFYNLRIFNCFGLGERSTRIFPKFISRNKQLQIINDRFFDYFCIQDLCTVIDSFIEYDYEYKDVNCVYIKKYKISQVLEKFCLLNTFPLDFFISSTSSNNYTGCGDILANLNLKLIGLENGLKNYFERDNT